MGKYDKVLAVLRKAQDAVRDRKDILLKLGLFSTLDEQLTFMHAFFAGEGGEQKRLHEINVGLIGMREISAFDEPLADLLSVAQFIAHKKGEGLKIDEAILEKYLNEPE